MPWFSKCWIKRIDARLARIEQTIAKQGRATREEIEMATAQVQAIIDEMKTELEAQTSATVAMQEAMDRLLAQIEDAKDDPAELQALLDGFRANTGAIAAAAMKGTSGEEPTPPA